MAGQEPSLEVRFFLDFAGHQDDPQVRKALAALKENMDFLKVLGL